MSIVASFAYLGIQFDSVAMVERRNPLVLSSTRTTLRSVLNSLQSVSSNGDRVLNHDEIVLGGSDLLRGNVKLSAGILRWHKDDAKLDSLDDSALVGLSTQLLKRLSINSGSLVSPSCICLVTACITDVNLHLMLLD